MFFGEFLHMMDEKSRVRIPSKLKNNLINGYVITKGTNSCLFIFSKEYFEKEFLVKLNNVPTFDINSQKPIRLLLSSTYEVEEDLQGRFILPAGLKEFAGITKNIVFIGVGSRIEMWNEENWNKYKGNEHKFDEIIGSLSSFNV